MRRFPRRRRRGRGLLITVALALLGTLLVVGGQETPVRMTANLSQFSAGNIISDSIFFNGTAMSGSAVDAFIALQGAGCRAGSDGTPCLKNFSQTTTSRASDAYCNGYAAAPNESAGQILAKIGASCGVNPQALLVMLQKEQGLVLGSGSSLSASRYRIAMGFGCPDTAACDSNYYGFQNQVWSAARQFKLYAAKPTSYGYRAGRTNNVYYNPNAGCGSGSVYIQNQATAGLYNYTPYQPNAAALAAGYGSGDSCSSYGNRNFWLYFTDWFGSTQMPGQSAWSPIGHLDAVLGVTGNSIEVQGWTVDPDSVNPIAVEIYVDGQFSMSVAATGDRPDLTSTLPTFGSNHGFDYPVPVSVGPHTVCAYGINVGGPAANGALGCLAVDTGGLPFGNVDTATVVEGRAELTGWAVDGNSSSAIDVHVYSNGQFAGYGTANTSRPDVGLAYPGAGNNRGFDVTASLQPGANQVCAFAINVPAPAYNPQIGCRTLTLHVVPLGNLESVTAGARSVDVAGWALDPETSQPIDVHVYVDGVDTATVTADGTRPDVANNHPDLGARHGFTATVPVTPGADRQVCVYAMNVKQGTTNPQLGCSTVNVGVPPVGHLDVVSASGFEAQVKGWALDPDTANPIDVQIQVDGKPAVTATTATARPDVVSVYPGSGSTTGFEVPVPTAAGTHLVCASAVNTLGGRGDTSLGCLTVTVAGGRTDPLGVLDSVSVADGVTEASGWVIDPTAPATPASVQLYVDGAYAKTVPAGDPRPDVASAYAGAGAGHGYTAALALAAGRHTVCSFGVGRPGAGTPFFGCGTVTVP